MTCSTVFLFLSTALRLSLIRIYGICPAKLLKIGRHWKMFWYLRRRISIPFFDKTTQAHLCNLPLRNFRQCMDILALTNLSPLLALHSRSLSTRLLSTSVISPSSSRSANLESILSLHHHLGINALPGLTALSTQSGSSFSWTPPSLISIGSELVWLLMLQGASGSILPST